MVVRCQMKIQHVATFIGYFANAHGLLSGGLTLIIHSIVPIFTTINRDDVHAREHTLKTELISD